MSYQAYKQAEQEFARNIMKERLGQTTRYGGHLSQGIRKGLVSRLPSLARIKLNSTEKTWRVCRTCRGTRATATHHINGMVSILKCQTCKGEGRVFG